MPTRTDYLIVLMILTETAIILSCLLCKVSLIGYALPLCIAAVAFFLSGKAYWDFFQMNK